MKILLDGAALGSQDAFTGAPTIAGGTGNVTIRGLAFVGWRSGINISTTSNWTVRDNFFGTDVTGNIATGNLQSQGVGIGGSVTGVAVLHNLFVAGAVSRAVSPQAVAINGSAGNGSHVIQGNLIGTDSRGNLILGLPLAWGITALSTTALTIGGSSAGEGNVIGNTGTAILLRETTSSTLRGNHIGVGADGTSVISNANTGIELLAFSDNTTRNIQIGGLGNGEGNIVANNNIGISITASTGSAPGNAILSNSIYSNFQSSITLGAGGRDQDTDDADTGANNAQNFPDINNTRAGVGAEIFVEGHLQSTPFTDFTIQLFASTVCSFLGHGPGRTLLTTHTGTTNSTTGLLQFDLPVTLPASQSIITATATDANGNTSEFSSCFDAGATASTPGKVGLSEAEYEVREGDSVAALGTGRLIAVTRENGTQGRIQIRYSSRAKSGGLASAGTDYTAVDGDLVFEEGETSQTFFLPITDDNDSEPPEQFELFLSSPLDVTDPNNAIADDTLLDSARSVSTVTINDNEIVLSLTDSVPPDFDQSIEFESTFPGDTRTESVRIKNIGTFPVSLSTATIVDPSQRFTVDRSNCFPLPPGSMNCRLDVTFEPVTEGTYQSLLRIDVDGQINDVALRGESSSDIDLSIIKVSDKAIASAGDDVTYTVTVINAGPAEATGVEITDQLPAGISFVSANAIPAAAYDPGTGIWTVGTLAATAPDNMATLTLNAQVDAGVGNAIITNTATITTSVPVDPDTIDNAAEARIGIGGADLEVTSIVPNRLSAGGLAEDNEDDPFDASPNDGIRPDTITFKVTVTNNGPESVGDIKFKMAAPSRLLAYLEVDPRSCTEPTGRNFVCPLADYIYTPGLTLAPGESVDFNILASVATFRGDTSLTVEVFSSSGTFDPNPDNNRNTSATVQLLTPVGSSREGCFIATAAYGTLWEPHVVSLRRFRDGWLLTNAPGRAFVDWYYASSPPVAAWIAERDWARAMVRGGLTPVVIFIENPITVFLLLAGVGGLWIARRRIFTVTSGKSRTVGW